MRFEYCNHFSDFAVTFRLAQSNLGLLKLTENMHYYGDFTIVNIVQSYLMRMPKHMTLDTFLLDTPTSTSTFLSSNFKTYR